MPPPPPPPLPPPAYDPHRLEANGTHQRKIESPGFLVFVNAVNIITHFLLGAIAFSAFFFAATVKYGTLTIGIWTISFPVSLAQHIYLCVTGYIILMSQAMLVFNPYVGWATYLQQSQKRIIHIIMQIGGSTLAIVGSIIKMADSNASWNSPHAYLGFIAMILTIFSLFGGIMNFVCTRKGGKNAVFQLLHTCLGALTITIAFIALIVAFHEYYRAFYNDASTNLSITFTVLALVGILTLLFFKLFRRT